MLVVVLLLTSLLTHVSRTDADVHYHSKTGKHETELRNCPTKDKVEVFRHDPAEYCTQRRCFLLKKFKKIQKSGRLAR